MLKALHEMRMEQHQATEAKAVGVGGEHRHKQKLSRIGGNCIAAGCRSRIRDVAVLSVKSVKFARRRAAHAEISVTLVMNETCLPSVASLTRGPRALASVQHARLASPAAQ